MKRNEFLRVYELPASKRGPSSVIIRACFAFVFTQIGWDCTVVVVVVFLSNMRRTALEKKKKKLTTPTKTFNAACRCASGGNEAGLCASH